MTEVRDLPPVHVVPIGEVREAANNPRKITSRAVELLALSLKEFGWKQPLVVDENGVLIVGHTRRRAAASLGLKHVPVIYAADLTPEQAHAYRIADNRTSDFTTWDFAELVPQLEELSPDFMDVLALADWHQLMEDFTEVQAQTMLDLDDSIHDYTRNKYQLTVVFETAEDAATAAVTIMDLPGVLDVRNKRDS